MPIVAVAGAAAVAAGKSLAIQRGLTWIKNLAVKGFNLAKKDGAKWITNNFKLSGRGADKLGINNVATQQVAGNDNLLKYAAAAVAAFTLFK
tara:strand:- start:177 stop:452 length:276 start_codon:yes stop_codon:yes gene_type:complete